MKCWFSFTLALALCCSCTQKAREKIIIVPADEPMTENRGGPDLNKVRAEKLINMAEELISPVGFMVADQIVDLALKQDPTNRKAQFYKAVLAPLMKLRGINVRMSKEQWLLPAPRYLSMLAAEGVLGDFLRDSTGGPPFNSEVDVQNFLAEIQTERQKLADFISKNKTLIMRIPLSHVYNWNKMILKCPIQKISNDSYRITPCPHMQQIKLNVNRADWEVLLQFIQATEMSIDTLLSYNLEGGLGFAIFSVKRKREEKDFTAKEKVEMMNQSPNFGRLFSQHHLNQVLDQAKETYSGLTWLYGVQPELCGKGVARYEHVFQQICLKRRVPFGPARIATADGLELIRASLEGSGSTARAAKPFKAGVSGSMLNEVSVDVAAPLKYPIQDLKTLAPKSFDDCGNALSLQDPTLGGVFKSADADKFLISKHYCKAGKH